MKSVMVEETQNAREDVFNDYLIYYQQVWPQGNLSLCQETEKAKRFLLAECDPDSRFTVFDFYQTVSECLTGGRRDCRDVLKELVKATELLEILCVNLFLFPWKKEIKTLKTFTGPFVYWIKPVLPQNMVKGILESIGYRPETDTEYKLDKSADPERATRMGFELFLARQECEYLLEVMGQNGPWECAEILQLRYPRAPQSLYGANESVGAETGEEPASAGRESTSLQVNGEEELDSGHSLLDPGEEVVPEEGQALAGTAGGGDEDSAPSPRRLDFQPRDEAAEPRDLLPDDRSINEMRENYPDLAFRQRPIFREPQGRPEKQEKGRRTPKGGAVVFGDQGASASAGRLSESRPVTGVTAPSPKLKRRPPDARAEDKDSAPAEARHAETPRSPAGAQRRTSRAGEQPGLCGREPRLRAGGEDGQNGRDGLPRGPEAPRGRGPQVPRRRGPQVPPWRRPRGRTTGVAAATARPRPSAPRETRPSRSCATLPK
ncbi:hypothetical protein SKAU_G00346070 [Synaphobranchus kaupii]|uniref:Spermatogenesis-associated protein 2 PUB-like domain-containing protein n=1 Tax=Synaphobranchus kaupii TaxID=118154 RepID=A0A9Q1IHR3_SYNKA|nr:hypothetical protein SKAU_G00346070 [Synaphobranchus kaupii]